MSPSFTRYGHQKQFEQANVVCPFSAIYMAPFASLPQEIVDTFVDELAVLSEAGASGSGYNAQVKGNLRCMQVSRTRARRHLFSDVTLVVRVNQASTKSSRNFRILLDSDPSLAKEVSSLKIDLMDYPSEPVNSKILVQSYHRWREMC